MALTSDNEELFAALLDAACTLRAEARSARRSAAELTPAPYWLGVTGEALADQYLNAADRADRRYRLLEQLACAVIQDRLVIEEAVA